MQTAKQLAEDVLRRLPDDTTVEDILDSIHVADLLERRGKLADEAMSLGIDEAIKQGKLIPHEEVKARFQR